MRNEPFELNAQQTHRANTARQTLAAYVGHSHGVRIEATKRDGSPTVLEGPVTSMGGHTPSHEYVAVATERGPRSINLWNVRSITDIGPVES